MVTICAWCERYLGTTGEAGPVVTHGICAPCAARQRWTDAPVIVIARHRAELHTVLKQLLRGEPAMRIVVDRRVGDRRRSKAEPGSTWDNPRGRDRRRRPPDAIFI